MPPILLTSLKKCLALNLPIATLPGIEQVDFLWQTAAALWVSFVRNFLGSFKKNLSPENETNCDPENGPKTLLNLLSKPLNDKVSLPL
jgi:hypothetical protein